MNANGEDKIENVNPNHKSRVYEFVNKLKQKRRDWCEIVNKHQTIFKILFAVTCIFIGILLLVVCIRGPSISYSLISTFCISKYFF